MKVEIAFDIKKAKSLSWQADFPKTAKCCKCDGEARLGFVAHETEKHKKGNKYVCHLYKNEPKGSGFWVHDMCCVAVYFCKKCLETTALYNQA